jgi:3-oxoacyl-[acyl-carrier protein] reductase
MNRLLEGKTALITGGSRGLGRAVAEEYAALGALVAINYASNDAAARDTLQAIEAKGGNAFLIKSAQGSYAAAEELAAALDAGLKERTGSTALDILVNNAGGGPVHDIDSTTAELFEKVLGDNLRGPFFVTKLLKPRMRDGGSIIFLSSLGARAALPQYVVYALSMRAIETRTVIMAKELGPRDINVNCISPGIVASDSNADIRADKHLENSYAQLTALKRLGVPSDLSGVAVALVSPQMRYVTGQIIEVSGGMWL